jgi:hypothetical protein
MSCHHQARQDCLEAVRELSILPSRRRGVHSPALSSLTVRDLVSRVENARAGDLTASQLEMLLSHRKEGQLMHAYLVSLGDLGRKDIRHEPGDPGTTKSFQDAKTFFDGFGNIQYDVVTGNHDLEGLDEFDTDQENLQAWMDIFQKSNPQFIRYIGERTVLLGLSTTRFRDAPYSSHEVHVDDAQVQWFIQQIKNHPDSEGWKILVFSHAPIMGSGLRVLQNVHVTNGCAWLNHCSPRTRNLFFRTVQANPAIKLWFSGHFHLSHDYQDSISSAGSCTFVQVGVIGPASTRDQRRQTRIVQGSSDRLKVYSVNHHERRTVSATLDDGATAPVDKAVVRLDADIDLTTGLVHFAHEDQDFDRDDWFQAYTPRKEDGYVLRSDANTMILLNNTSHQNLHFSLNPRCYIEAPDGSVADASSIESKVCWWHMADGRVLGLHQSQLIEYDSGKSCRDEVGHLSTSRGSHIVLAFFRDFVTVGRCCQPKGPWRAVSGRC